MRVVCDDILARGRVWAEDTASQDKNVSENLEAKTKGLDALES